MTVFYKATRPDGTDFRTGRVLYEVGRRVRPLPFDGERRICGPGLLHAADVPAETLVGGGWPCRLFEVTGKPVAGLNDQHPHKAGFRQLRVLREIDACGALGPNGRAVADVIARAGRLTRDETDRLCVAWAASYAAKDAAREAARARDAAWDAARPAARDAARWTARATLAAWYAARDAASARDAAWVRDAAWCAARDAAAAMVVRDLITDEQFEALYGPWRSVVG